TTPPAAEPPICSRPPEDVVIRSATRTADMPGPGSRLGHEVTMRHLTGAARATAGAASTPARAGPAFISLRRVILAMASPSWPPSVKMMHRPMARTDREPVGAGDRQRHVSLRLGHGFAQLGPLGVARRSGWRGRAAGAGAGG